MVALSSYKLVNCFILLLVVILILVRCVVLFDIKILVSLVLLLNCQVEKCLNEIYFCVYHYYFQLGGIPIHLSYPTAAVFNAIEIKYATIVIITKTTIILLIIFSFLFCFKSDFLFVIFHIYFRCHSLISAITVIKGSELLWLLRFIFNTNQSVYSFFCFYSMAYNTKFICNIILSRKVVVYAF